MASAPDRPPFLSRRSTRVGLAISIVMLLIGAGGAWYVFAAGSHPLTVSNAVERFRGYQPVPADTSGATPSASPSGKPTASPSPGQTSTTSTRTTAKSASAVKPWPSEGVYTYATEGGEETDALSGQSHDYPSSTTISIHHDGCGSIYRWQPLSERWDESEACKTTRGVALHRFSMYHEFFHQGLREDFACGSDAIVMPWVQRAGDHWNFRCKSSGTTLDMTVRVVGFESVPVGGRSIR